MWPASLLMGDKQVYSTDRRPCVTSDQHGEKKQKPGVEKLYTYVHICTYMHIYIYIFTHYIYIYNIYRYKGI